MTLLLGGCPRGGIFSQIEAFSKNKHRHIVDISESRSSLTGALFFVNNKELGKRAFSDSLLAQVVARLQRLYKNLGYGNFGVVGFDEAVGFAQNYFVVGKFTAEELDFEQNAYSRTTSSLLVP